MVKIGIVEDDVQLNNAIKLLLEKAGFVAEQAFSCSDALHMLKESVVDVLLLDVSLPDGEGFSICKQIPKELQIPVIFLTARDEEVDILKAFDEGCEDYIIKPFSMNVLLKRIEVVLRRKRKKQNTYQIKNIILNVDRHEVKIDNTCVNLTTKEFDILHLLMKNKNRVITKDIILNIVWDSNEQYVDDSSVAVTISRLRKKLSNNPKEYITNVFGSGYLMGD